MQIRRRQRTVGVSKTQLHTISKRLSKSPRRIADRRRIQCRRQIRRQHCNRCVGRNGLSDRLSAEAHADLIPSRWRHVGQCLEKLSVHEQINLLQWPSRISGGELHTERFYSSDDLCFILRNGIRI